MVEVISTGIQRLDHILIEGKGIAAGSTVLIEGTSGAGKELFAKQFAAAGVGPAQPGHAGPALEAAHERHAQPDREGPRL